MSIALATNWWSLVVRGVAALLFGVLTIMWPGITLTALVFLFAAYALIDGIVNIAGMVKAIHRHDRWGVLLLEGIVGVAAAAVAVAWPAITAVALVYLIAAWAIVTGGFEVAAAVRLRKHVSGEWLLALSGIASLVFGILLMIAAHGCAGDRPLDRRLCAHIRGAPGGARIPAATMGQSPYFWAFNGSLSSLMEGAPIRGKLLAIPTSSRRGWLPV